MAIKLYQRTAFSGIHSWPRDSYAHLDDTIQRSWAALSQFQIASQYRWDIERHGFVTLEPNDFRKTLLAP